MIGLQCRGETREQGIGDIRRRMVGQGCRRRPAGVGDLGVHSGQLQIESTQGMVGRFGRHERGERRARDVLAPGDREHDNHGG